MNPGRFFLPNMTHQFTPFMRGAYLQGAPNLGLFGRITNSIRRFNWSGLLNGANKTLNVVNQTIPLVRQAGPMFSNMKNMFKIAKAFGNETVSSSPRRNINLNSANNKLYQENTSEVTEINQKKEVTNDNYPNFFI